MSDDWDNEPVVMPTLIKQPAAPAADGWSDDETPVPASRSFAEKPSVDNSNGFGELQVEFSRFSKLTFVSIW